MTSAASLQSLAATPQGSGSWAHTGVLLQRKCVCGSPSSSLTGECEQCKITKVLQTKLTIGASNDPLEQEADRIADQVLEAPGHSAVSGAPPRIQRYTGEVNGQADTAPASVYPVLAGSGRPLDPALQQDMGQRFGHDFSRVRVHSGAAAEQSTRDVKAHAYTVGQAIVFGAGRFAPGTRQGRRLLAHELTHVVQQSGADGMNVGQSNDKRGLSHGLSPIASAVATEDIRQDYQLPVSPGVQRQVIQRKKVPTDYGEFETTKFVDANDSGVEIVLMFNPDETKVDAKKIALAQSVKATNEAKKAYAINPSIASRMVKKGKGAGYAIDASGDTNNPLYFDIKNLGQTEELKDTPSPASTPAKVGDNTHYDFGYCYKKYATDPEKIKHPAGLYDRPQGLTRKRAGMMFETTALAIEGTDKDKYYGSVKWGYTIGGTAAAPKVVKTDIEQASMGTPTANFIAPAKLWNAGTTRGTLVVDPSSPHNKKDAYIDKVSGGGADTRLAKGTKLKQLDVIKGTTEGMIKAEVLDVKGAGTGVVVNIYVADVKDIGDGDPNKKLP